MSSGISEVIRLLVSPRGLLFLCACIFGQLSSAAAPNDRWYTKSDSDTVFVFVHGIFSNSDDCWTNPKGTYWPALIKADPRLQNPSVYLGGYDTRIDGGSFGIYDAADQLFSNLSVQGVDGSPAPLKKHNIVFIAHSTGGIVVRQLIATHTESFKDKTVGVVLIASPGRGSQWANRLQWLNKYFDNRMAEQLQRGNDFLDSIDREFADLVSHKKDAIPKITGVDVFETKFILPRPIYLFFLGSEQFVVSAEDTGSYFGAFKQIPNSDHFSIVKPFDITDPIQTLLVDFYQNTFLPLTRRSASVEDWGTSRSVTGRKVFSAQISLFTDQIAQKRFNQIWKEGITYRVNSVLTSASQFAPPEFQFEGFDFVDKVEPTDFERLSIAGRELNGVAVSATSIQKRKNGGAESYLTESTFRPMYPLPDGALVFPTISEQIPGGENFGPITLQRALSSRWGYYVLLSLATRCMQDGSNVHCDFRRLTDVLTDAYKRLGAGDEALSKQFTHLIAVARDKSH